MFFPLLSFEEKNNCLALIKHAAMCDDNFHQKEKALISGYALLMGLDQHSNPDACIDDVIAYFSQRSDIVKRAVFLETLGLIEADNLYHQAEEKLLKRLAGSFGFDGEYINSAKEWVKNILPHYYKGFELVGVKID